MATKPSTTVMKAFQVLTLFQRRATLTVNQCALLLGAPRASVHRLLVSLEAVGAVERTPEGHFQLGLRLLEIGSFAHLRQQYGEHCRGHLQRLSADTGLPVHLAGRDEEFGVLLEVVPGTRYNIPTRVGLPIPMHSTALGKLLLANAPDQFVEAVAASPLPRFTRYTIDNVDRLTRELDDIRGQGLSYDRQETHYGLICVAAPIRTPAGEVRTAVSLTYPANAPKPTASAYRDHLLAVRNHIEDEVAPKAA